VTPADLARFELAKQAYKATQPGVAEVQAGVRRARLSLPRPKARRSWFSKGLIFVVLAVGSLAYAKPHALTDLVGDMLPRERGAAKGERKLGVAVVVPPVVANTPSTVARATTPPAQAVAEPSQPPSALPPSGKHQATSASNAAKSAARTNGAQRDAASSSRSKAAAGGDANASDAKASDAKASDAKASDAKASAATANHPKASAATANDAAASNADASDDSESAQLSNWGRVGQALAHGDEASALTVLDQLSQSPDMRTRDKADLGRAQLLMAQGNREAACSLARSLTHRRAGGRIERQALALLKSCEP
jgi:hypothetical protein